MYIIKDAGYRINLYFCIVVANFTAAIMRSNKGGIYMILNKETMLAGASAVLGVATFVINVVTQKDEDAKLKKVAEEAVKTVLNQTSK